MSNIQETFAIIKPDAFGQPWLENVLEKNDEEEVDPGVDEDGEPLPKPPREEWKVTVQQRAPDMGIEILKRIEAAGFEIVQRKTVLLTPKVRL